jgi:hypothetical protein
MDPEVKKAAQACGLVLIKSLQKRRRRRRRALWTHQRLLSGEDGFYAKTLTSVHLDKIRCLLFSPVNSGHF